VQCDTIEQCNREIKIRDKASLCNIKEESLVKERIPEPEGLNK